MSRKERGLPNYRCPFENGEEANRLAEKYLQSKAVVSDEECLRAGSELLIGRDLRLNFQTIFRWKLQSFINRFNWVREFPDKEEVTDDALRHIAELVRNATANGGAATKAIQELTNLRRVGVPVASAFLMAVHPNDFTVIDRQAYKALKVEFIEPIPLPEYLHYVAFCQQKASALGVTLRTFDRALWQTGSDLGKKLRTR